MPIHDDLGLRMKENYEKRSRSYLTRRTPVIIRIDGKAFHTFTKGFNKPYDKLLMTTMQETMQYLCEHIQGTVLGYTQSDEISLLLVDYKKFESDSWFDYQIQKVCSISASIATMIFNKKFSENFAKIDPMINLLSDYWYDSEEEFIANDYMEEFKDIKKFELDNILFSDKETFAKIIKAYRKSEVLGALFDSRCFNIPKEEVTNYFFWRQEDATRNSIQMAGQAQFSHKELLNKSCNEIQDMLHEEKGINWNDYPVEFKRGSCARKIQTTGSFTDRYGKVSTFDRNEWAIDKNIPIFKGDEGRKYIDKLVNCEEK